MVKPERKIVMKKKKRPSRPSRFSNSTGSRPAADFEKLRDDLFLEAAKLVTENPSHRIAIIIGPPRTEPNGAMHSFGHPSAESVVRKFLKDSAPPEKVVEEEEEEEEEEDEDWSKYCWWEDEKLVKSKDPVEIMAAMVEMKKLQKQLEIFKSSYFGGSERGEGSGTKDDESKP